VGTGAFGSDRSLHHAALPTALESAPSVPFTSAANLESVYLPSALDRAVRVGLKHPLPVYHRSAADGWDDDGVFDRLSLYGPKPSELIPLSSVTVTGGDAVVGDDASPYHAAT